MANKLNKKQILKRGGIAALKLRIKEEVKKERLSQYILTENKIKSLQEQSQGTLYKISVSGCIKCPPGSGIGECPYSDGSCSQSIKNEMDIATGKSKPTTPAVIVGTESPSLNDIKASIKETLQDLKKDNKSQMNNNIQRSSMISEEKICWCPPGSKPGNGSIEFGVSNCKGSCAACCKGMKEILDKDKEKAGDAMTVPTYDAIKANIGTRDTPSVASADQDKIRRQDSDKVKRR